MIAPAVVLAVALVPPLAAAARPEAPSVTMIDRTVVCEAGVIGGIRKLKVIASSAIREGPQKHDAGIEVVTRASPSRLTGVGEGWLDLSPKCARSNANVELTWRGLSGGRASIFGDELGCPTPRPVVVRVRAVFTGRAALTLGSPFPGGARTWYAIGHVREGAIAIRTLAGRRIAYATVSDTGRARLFTAGTCGA